MADSNLPTIYQNVMDGLPTDFARDVFLWASDKFQHDRHAYKAEAFAREADQLVRSIKGLIDAAQMSTLRRGGLVMNENQADDLLRFIQVRHANYRMGGNVKSAPPLLQDGRRCHGGGKPDPMRPSAGCDRPSIYRPCTLGGPK